MAGHVVNGQLDPDRPASLSKPTVTDLLRGELGWDGIVVTDDLQAAAITNAFGRDEAVLLALEAGNDLLLFANQQVYDREDRDARRRRGRAAPSTPGGSRRPGSTRPGAACRRCSAPSSGGSAVDGAGDAGRNGPRSGP